jgi:AraC-like DNA-binding protein
MHLLEILALLGTAQGVLLLLLIGLRFHHRKCLPLALLLLAYSLRLGTIPSWQPDVLAAHSWLMPVTTPLPLLFGPLLWWYVRELAHEEHAVPRLLPLHFLPYALETIAVLLTVVPMGAEAYRALVADIFSGQPPLWLPLRNALKVVVNVVYIGLAARIAFARPPGERGLEHSSRDRRTSAANVRLLRAIVVAPVASLVPFAFVAIHPDASARLADGSALPFAILAGVMASLIYALSAILLVNPRIVSGRSLFRKPRGNGIMSPEEAACLCSRVEAALRKGAFQDSELSVERLASSLHVHPKRLSVALNGTCRCSFPQLLNEYRVNYFMRQVRSNAMANRNILELAFDAGFPSKSTFNRVFKEHVGVSPSTFVERESTAKPVHG